MNLLRLISVALLLAVSLPCPVICADFTVWVQDALVKLTPDARPLASSARAVVIDAVRNEYESGQIVISSGSARLEEVRVSVGSFKGPGKPMPQAEAGFVGFVRVTKGTPGADPHKLVANPGAEIADPILDARSVTVEPDRCQPVFVTVYVPKQTPPGRYTADIAVSAGGSTKKVPLVVDVHTFTLPDERTLHITNWLSTSAIADAHGVQRAISEGYWKLLGAYARMIAEHRQTFVIVPLLELIDGFEDAQGRLTFKFDAFDRYVETFRTAGVMGIEGNHLASRDKWEDPGLLAYTLSVRGPEGPSKLSRRWLKTDSKEFENYIAAFLPAFQKHLEEKGWLDDYIQHINDEPVSTCAASYKALAAMVRKYAPKFRIIEACMCSDLVGAIDIWVPQPPHYEEDVTLFRDRQRAGEEVWFYTCLSPTGKYMNRFIDYPLIDVRLLHWANFKYDLTGYLHWGLNHWGPEPMQAYEMTWGDGSGRLPPGDSHIIYPGRRGPLSSIRFDAMRDGIEDYELLKLLEKNDPREARRICDSIVRSFTDYTIDPERFKSARMRLIAALSGQSWLALEISDVQVHRPEDAGRAG